MRRRMAPLNGRLCQRCEGFGRRTPLRGDYKINCPRCWEVLNKVYTADR